MPNRRRVSVRVSSSIGSRLQTARKLANISARELDRLAGITEGHSSLIEADRVSNLTLHTVNALARVLGTSIDWLANGTGNSPRARAVQSAVDAARAA